MREHTIKLFEIDELSGKAKERAREWCRRGIGEDTWWSEAVIEDAVTQAKSLGITINTRTRRTLGPTPKPIHDPCVYWSGFYSQGDGACFEGYWYACDVNAAKLKDDCPVDKELHRIVDVFASIAKEYQSARFTVKHRGTGCHSRCTDFDVDLLGDEWRDGREVPDDVYRRDEDVLIETARDFMDWIYSQLEKEWDYINSDESVDEHMRANGYEFTEDGERFRE